MNQAGLRPFLRRQFKLFEVSVTLLIAVWIVAGLLSCKSTARRNLLGIWQIQKTTHDTNDSSEEGLAASVLASNLASGMATWEFRADDSAIIINGANNKRYRYSYALQPNGSSIILEDKALNRTDTLDAIFLQDTLRMYDRSRRIGYVLTRNGIMQ